MTLLYYNTSGQTSTHVLQNNPDFMEKVKQAFFLPKVIQRGVLINPDS